LTVNGLVVYKLPPVTLPADRAHSLSAFYLVNRLVNFVWFNWFVVGVVWAFETMQTSQCRLSAPFMLSMVHVIVAVQLCMIALFMVFFSVAFGWVVLRAHLFPNARLVNSPGASEREIRKLKIRKFRDGLVPKDDANCCICLGEYQPKDRIRFLPCKHHQHADCLDTWLQMNASCPVCKKDVR